MKCQGSIVVGGGVHFLSRHKAVSSAINMNLLISHYALSKLMCRLFDHLNLHCVLVPPLFAYLTTLSALTLFSIQPTGTIIGHHHHQQQQQQSTSLSTLVPSSWLLVCPSLPWSSHVSAVGRNIFLLGIQRPRTFPSQ
jgi:hypothetical protein